MPISIPAPEWARDTGHRLIPDACFGSMLERAHSYNHMPNDSEQAAVELFLDLLKQKQQKGYRSRLSTDCERNGWPHPATPQAVTASRR